MNIKIDFIGIGAQKAGTTWLFSRLNELPNFSLAPNKEVHYFDRAEKYPSTNRLLINSPFIRMLNFKWLIYACWNTSKQIWKEKSWSRFRWYFHYYFTYINDGWYFSLFKGLEGVKGEVTPSYSLLDYQDVSRMSKLLPDTKIILMLRNPIDRAWSHFRFDNPKLAKEIDLGNVESNFPAFQSFIDGKKQEARSNYLQFLRLYGKEFKGRLLVGFFDALIDNPVGLLEETIDFLESDVSLVKQHCKISEKNNVSRKVLIPDKYKNYLEKKYFNSIKEMHETLGSYSSLWYKELKGNKLDLQIRELSPTCRL